MQTEEKLKEVLSEREKWEQAQAELQEQLKAIKENEAALHHKLACDGVVKLFELLDNFADMFVNGAIKQKYTEILDCLESIKQHDPEVDKSLASNVYRDIVISHDYFDYWLGLIQKHLVTNDSLARVLGQVFNKTHNTPFEG